MKSVCFFSSYYTGDVIPNYVKFYLSELTRHFSEVVFLTNEKVLSPDDLQFLSSYAISYRIYQNEGYDFGMWYKAFKEFDLNIYDRVGLVNDSCILFNKLDFFFNWLNKQNIDYSGFTDCDMINYHIQSYFIIINKKAIPHTLKYFDMNGIITDMTRLIKTYEVGLCTYLLDAGMNLFPYYSFKSTPRIGNPSWMKAKNLIRAGYPLIKKKIMIRYYGIADWRSTIANGFDPYPNHYIRLIKKVVPTVNLDELLMGLPMRKPLKAEVKFYSIALLSQVYGMMKRMKQFIKRMIYGSPKKGFMTIGADAPNNE